MKGRILAAVACTVALAGCETLVAPRYSASGDNNVAVKALGVGGLGVGEFTGPANFDPSCRAVGPVQVPDGMTHTQYIRKAFEEEFKIAGIYAGQSPRVLITGNVTKLDFSSTRGLLGGAWDIEVTLTSSNGKSMKAEERYEFSSGFLGNVACKQTSDAFTPAVQNLIGKVFRSPEFSAMVK